MNSSFSIKKWIGLIAILALPGAIYFFVTMAENNFMPLATIGPDQHHIPDFSFINQGNDTITKKDYSGSIYVANFFFTTCPTICPIMTNKMKYESKRSNKFSHPLMQNNIIEEDIEKLIQSLINTLKNY